MPRQAFLKLPPRYQEPVPCRDLPLVKLRLFRKPLRLAQQENRAVRQVFQNTGGCRGLLLLQQPQFAPGRDRDGPDFLPRHLRDRIEEPKRLQLVPEKLQPHRPRAGQWPKIHNAAAHGNVPLLRHLDFRLVGLFLQPFDQVERVPRLPAPHHAQAPLKVLAPHRLLQQRRHAAHHQRTRSPPARLRQRHQRRQPFADDIRVRQPLLVRQHFPCRIKQRRGARFHPGSRRRPCFGVLLENFLRPQPLRHNHDGPIWKKPRK